MARPRRSFVARRSTSWAVGASETRQLTAVGVTLWAVGSQAVVPGLTLVRTRGELLVAISSVAAVTDTMRMAFGLCVVSENAFGAGVGSVPTPDVDMAWDGWLWHRFVSLAVSAGSEAGTARIEIDSKAMRKIKETDVLIGVTEVIAESGTVVCSLRAETRVLMKLA